MAAVRTDDLRTQLRVAIATADGAALVALLRQGWPDDALQSIGDGLASAAAQGVPGAAELAEQCVTALRERGWDGDLELADQLEGLRGTAPTPLLSPRYRWATVGMVSLIFLAAFEALAVTTIMPTVSAGSCLRPASTWKKGILR